MSGASAPRAFDTSVLLGALSEWHPRNREFGSLLLSSPFRVPSHVLVETYSVLTRMPLPRRAKPLPAASALAAVPAELITLPAQRQKALLAEMAAAGIYGGATYDALIGATAKHHGLVLLTADHRARSTYEALGVAYELV